MSSSFLWQIIGVPRSLAFPLILAHRAITRSLARDGMQVWTIFRDSYRKSFNYAGRATRRDYWVFYAIALGVSSAGNGLARIADDIAPHSIPLPLVLGFLLSGLGIANFFPLLALTVRRLHDVGISGWWYPVAIVVAPVLATGTAIAITRHAFPGVMAGWGALMIGGIAMLVVTVRPGDRSENRYGPPPTAILENGRG